MAQAVPDPQPVGERRRVKVYELRNNDWFDRGTGFASASRANENNDGEARIVVAAEENPEDRVLLETIISKQSQFQKQQDTLIIWTEPATSVDMALSFQEAEGCTSIWRFINECNQTMITSGPEDLGLDDSIMDHGGYSQASVKLPFPTLGNLKEIDDEMRLLSGSAQGRDSLAKFVVNEEYITKLAPLVEEAEDLEALAELHRLCNIMKQLILLNDNDIIEYAMSDEVVLGVVGALEYDPDFPSHKANHRQWLSDETRYREVVPIQEQSIRRKIHHTYRLQYLKDVVLARILDDPTFSILNSLIFYYQVDILNYIQTNAPFLKELFAIFDVQQKDERKRKEAVLFIQQCCAIAKNLQPQARNSLYNNLLSHGLLRVINYALRHGDVAVRVGATDVLVSVIDHDPQMIRQTIFRQISEKQTPLTDSLIDLLLVEVDLGVKAQIADAIKVLLDAGTAPGLAPNDAYPKSQLDQMARMRPQSDPQQDMFLANFYEHSAKKLFGPLMELKGRTDMNLNVQQVSLFEHLIEILWFFIRQHGHRSKYFIMDAQLCQRISQLLGCPEKHLKLSALRFFRNLLQLNDEFYDQQMMDDRLFLPIIDLLISTMPRDNLLNSACLDFFEYICSSNNRAIIAHIVGEYRDKLVTIAYVQTFRNLIQRHEMQQTYPNNPHLENSYMDTEEDTPGRNLPPKADSRWQGLREMDADEEAYFNTSDDEEDTPIDTPSKSTSALPSVNGVLPIKPLVDYPSDEENEAPADIGKKVDAAATVKDRADVERSIVDLSPDRSGPRKENALPTTPTTPKSAPPTPPERLSEKRRREEDEDDELAKLSQNKRRSSSVSSVGGVGNGMGNGKGAVGEKKTTISISTKQRVVK